MKKFNLMMLLLLFVTYISAQTFDLGEGRKSTLDQAGNYKVTWNQKTDNGGTVVGTFTGVIKDGKRNGTWVGRITYTNFYMTNGNAKSGTETITRGYTDGKVNGAYTYSYNVSVRTCRYDIFNKRWVYGQPEKFTEAVTGGFKDGQPHGKFNCSRSTFSEKITMEFDSGKPIGNWVVQNQGVTTIGFKNGFVIQNKFMDANGSGEELIYEQIEDIETLPNRQTVLATDAIDYFTYYMQGGQFTYWFDQYPKGSSEEDFSKVSWILVDYDNHLHLVGNVTQAQKDAFERNKTNAKEESIEKEWYKFVQENVYPAYDTAKNSKVYRISEGYALAKEFEQIDATYPDLKRYSFTHVTQLQSDYRFKYYREYAGTVKRYKEEFESKCKPMMVQLSKYNMTDEEKFNYILDNGKTEHKDVYDKEGTWYLDTKPLDEKGLKIVEPMPEIAIETCDVIAYLLTKKLIVGKYIAPSNNAYKGNSFATTKWKTLKEVNTVTIDDIKEAKISAMKQYYNENYTYAGFDWCNKSSIDLVYKTVSYSYVTPELMKLGSIKKLLKRLGL